ncbi:methionine ABC transporter ATP-binding protein [Acinetobacter larvae]|uniref:Cell division ATP-binding protein FtsE n=1 Tax=Acinetobacter larvae TaxID=1789224 RepID=A0A1B2LYC2_9GAMM|nr:methionine ABC transporter ATP-binding protein [Acinetobacter larvae]AOA57940.1 methionine ABC transporter ATP-binding protein [Acinetobacter larvae]
MVSFGQGIDFPQARTQPHIQIRHLNKYYSVNGQALHALKDINLDIQSGKILGIIGKSGAGKSSLLRTLNGLEAFDSGSILLQQQAIQQLSQHDLNQLRKKIGMIFQHFNLLSAKTIWQNVALPLVIKQTPADVIESRVRELLHLVGLADKADYYPSQLSGGQKQRVGIARALVNQPDLLLCDEATSALDPESTAAILSLLKSINQKLGITIVLITHEMQVIRDLCDDVVVLEQGQIIESGAVLNVFAQPQHPTTREFLQQQYQHHDIALHHSPSAAQHHTVLQLNYAHRLAQTPNLKELFAVFDQPVHLYQSHVDPVQQHSLGYLILAVEDTALELEALQKRLNPFAIQVEILGYV